MALFNIAVHELQAAQTYAKLLLLWSRLTFSFTTPVAPQLHHVPFQHADPPFYPDGRCQHIHLPHTQYIVLIEFLASYN